MAIQYRLFPILFALLIPLASGLSIETQFSPSAVYAASASISATTPKVATKLTLKPLTSKPKHFALLELTVETDGVVANPFDPTQFDLRVRFTAPSGHAVLVPAFWFQEFDNKLQPKGLPGWRVRLTPTESGEWRAQAELAKPKLTSPTIKLNIAENPTASGFVRIHPDNPRYFAYDNGDFYFPIGLNIGWSTQQGLAVLDDYTRWLDSLSQNGGNIARVWMAAWSFGIEWQDTGLGDYHNRQKQAWLLDRLFKLAEERGIGIMLCLINHGQFSTTVNPEWADNPYNATNGGMLKQPADFVTDAQAKEFFKRRLRYIAARYAYSTSLFAWEWWNEINWTPISEPQLRPWIREMTTHLRQFDPYNHLITTSFADGTYAITWRLSEISFSQQHDYTGIDPILEFRRSAKAIYATAPNKPLMQAEHGFAAAGADDQTEQEVIHFHNGLWAAPFLGYAGSGMYWWWDTLVDPHNLWGEFQSLATFLQGEELFAMQIATPTVTGGNISALALQGDDHALLWLRSDAYLASAVKGAYDAAVIQAIKSKVKLTDWQYEPPLVEGITIRLSGLQDGNYVARWYDPQAGRWLDEDAIQVVEGVVTLHPPSFDRDIAIKLSKQ